MSDSTKPIRITSRSGGADKPSSNKEDSKPKVSKSSPKRRVRKNDDSD